MTIKSLELAQTHALPEGGKSWSISSQKGEPTESLHFTGNRAALALVRLAAIDAASPVLEGLSASGASLGAVALAAPNRLPATEGQGPAYGADLYTATVPAAWLAPGLQLRAKASNYAAGTAHTVKVGADMPMRLYTLPFYLFGATDSTQPLSTTAAPDATTVKEIRAKWPVATLDASNHPAQRATWPTLVIGPQADSAGTAQPAYVMHNAGETKSDGFAPLGAVLSVLGKIRAANGDTSLPVQYYSPLIMVDAAGKYASPGGGIGSVGGDTGTGDFAYRGVFIHEQGHAYGLSHAGEAYDTGNYPYNWGSLNGSVWGYDPDRNELLPPFLPTTASTYKGCATQTFAGHARAIDSANRCVRQDPMQSGSGDQDPSYRFTLFSDFTTAAMQRHLEGVTILNSDGTHAYLGGKIVRDSGFPGGYKRWDGLDLKWVNVTPTTASNALYGVNNGLPQQIGVPVYTIVFSISKAGTAGTTQIYPPLAYTGNLPRTIDPTSAADRAAIDPNGSGAWRWFCDRYGCDYTLRVTYANGTARHVLFNNSFRPWFKPDAAAPADATDPLSGNSFTNFAVNLPADGAIAKIELLDTPMGWNGVPASPKVLASR